jgi:large subunit ribosomal protein L13
MTVIDADGLIMGRLSSIVAKKLLAGEKVSVVNAEKAIISGSKVKTYEDYDEIRNMGTREFGPYFPKRADRILKRTVRGMLPYKKARGRDAMSRLKIHIGIPSELANSELISFDEANMDRLSSSKYITLGELSRKLGSKF